MSELQPIGRALLIFGLIIAGVGFLLLLGPKASWLGRLPGDIAIHREHFSFYFPLTTCLLASLLISLIVWAIGRFRP